MHDTILCLMSDFHLHYVHFIELTNKSFLINIDFLPLSELRETAQSATV